MRYKQRGFRNVLFNTPSVTFDERAINNYNDAIQRGFTAQKALAAASKDTDPSYYCPHAISEWRDNHSRTTYSRTKGLYTSRKTSIKSI